MARQSTCFRRFLGQAIDTEHASSVPKMISVTATRTFLFMTTRQMPARNHNSWCHPPKFLSGVCWRRAVVDHVTRQLIDHHRSHNSGKSQKKCNFSMVAIGPCPQAGAIGIRMRPPYQNRFHFRGQICQRSDYLILSLLVLAIGLCLIPIGSVSVLFKKRASCWNSQIVNSRTPYCHNLRRRTALAPLTSTPCSEVWHHSISASGVC